METLVGQVLIDGLQVFMVRFQTFIIRWRRNFNTGSILRKGEKEFKKEANTVPVSHSSSLRDSPYELPPPTEN